MKNKGVYDDNNNNIGGLPFWKMRCVDVAFFLVLAHYLPTVIRSLSDRYPIRERITGT